MKTVAILAATLLLPTARAQVDTDTPVTKVVRVRGNADQLADMIRSVTHANIAGSNSMGAVIISGRSSFVESLEKTIAELDSGSQAANAGNDIELTAYILAGLSTQETGTSEVMNPALEPVVRQLQAIFPSKQYRTLGILYIHSGQNTELEASGTLGALRSESARNVSSCQLQTESLSLEKNNMIHLRRFRFSARMPVTTRNTESATSSYQVVDVGVRSEINLREGQKIVVGKTDVSSTGDSLFLVLSARVVR